MVKKNNRYDSVNILRIMTLLKRLTILKLVTTYVFSLH